MKIIKPTLIVDKKKAVKNINRIFKKVQQSGNVRFRPHFKTHQSTEVGRWFKDLGINSITVSSVDMARYFASGGWDNITIGVLVNPLQIQAINQLAATVELHLLVDSADMVKFLDTHLTFPVYVWIKIDTGYHRTGIEYNQTGILLETAKAANQSMKLRFKGLLTHSGHSYNTDSTDQLLQVYHDTVTKLGNLRDFLEKEKISPVEISVGDTPTASVVESFYGVDEVRPGNFIYYDVMQYYLQACRVKDIAAAVACPVIARYPQRNEIVVYGGAVHISKDYIRDKNKRKIHGLVARPDDSLEAWGASIPGTYVRSVSQEHGIIKTTPEFLQKVNVGDILMILPIHSCLAANLLK